MKRCALLFAALCLVAADEKKDTAKGDLDKLQGTWKVVAVTIDGNKQPADEADKGELVQKGDAYEFTMGGRTHSGTIKLDPTKKPKSIVRTSTSCDDKDKTYPGIYEVEGDDYKVCFSTGDKAPDKFESEAGSGNMLFVLKRKK
jgi:uncharacterized protein (TIGR03067 family)